MKMRVKSKPMIVDKINFHKNSFDAIISAGRYVMRTVHSTIGRGNKKARSAGKPMSYRKVSRVLRNRRSGRFASPSRLLFALKEKGWSAERINDYTGRYFTEYDVKTGVVKKRVGFDVDKKNGEVLVGAAGNDSLKPLFQAHEYGGMFEGRKYPARSYVKAGYAKASTKPAYQNIINRFKKTF